MKEGRGAAATRRDLRDLARLYGVQPRYRSTAGTQVLATSEAVVGVLRALGAEIDRPADAADALVARRLQLARRAIEPVTVAWEGRIASVDVRLPIGAAEGGLRIGLTQVDDEEPSTWDRVEAELTPRADDPTGFVTANVPVGPRLRHGYHRLFVEWAGGRGSSLVMAAPRRLPSPTARLWGLFVPLHAVPNGWGVGDFRDLERLSAWMRGRGGSVVATLPLLASFLDQPFEPSPYSPASRLFWNELYLDVEHAWALAGVPEAPMADRPAERGGFVDLRTTGAAKRRALEPLAERFFAGSVPRRYSEFLAERPELRDYARFRAEMEHRGTSWGDWPEAERGGVLRGDAEDDARGRYHLYAQWLAHEQLRGWADRSRTGEGLYLDLPLGASEASYDVWRHRDSFATGASAGAPADTFFPHGQSWGFPPLHPDRIREDGFRYPIACVRNLLRYASMLRIDHVMGLHRLFWIPAGSPPEHGVYVRYRSDEWYAVFSIEANRAGTVVVGEDLGTVPREVRDGMHRHGLLKSYVVQLEARREPQPALPAPSRDSVATVNTHDLPMWAAFWEGGDVALSRDLGIIDDRLAGERLVERRSLRSAIVAFLRTRGLLPPGEEGADPVLAASLEFLAEGDAAVVVATLEDLWLERRPQNVPGTGSERPNWRGRLAVTLEELAMDPSVTEVLSRIDRARSRR